jgi:hypothetical protein
MKNDVKRKMMLTAHANDALRSPSKQECKKKIPERSSSRLGTHTFAPKLKQEI